MKFYVKKRRIMGIMMAFAFMYGIFGIKQLSINVEAMQNSQLDVCEPNDTPQQAYPYDKVKCFNKTGLFSDGMRQSYLSSDSDKDYFYVNLTAGSEYFANLRNIGDEKWNMVVYKDGNIDELYDIPIVSAPGKSTERALHFRPKENGRYIIEISSNGSKINRNLYYFYVGPAERSSMYTFKANFHIRLMGGTYSPYYTLDLRNWEIPDNAYEVL